MQVWQHARMRHYLKEWREYRELTQDQVAGAVGLAHKGSIQKIEKHPEKDLSTRRAKALAAVLNIGSEDLYRRPDPVKDSSIAIRQDTKLGNESPLLGGSKMINELSQLIDEAADMPPELIPTAVKLLKTLKAVGEVRPSNPPSRAKEK